jgi:ABC-type sugar transport system permease subunit
VDFLPPVLLLSNPTKYLKASLFGDAGKMKKEIPEPMFAFFLFIPMIVLMTTWLFFPISYSFYTSLHEIILGRPKAFGTPFIGLENYIKIFKDALVLKTLAVTAIFIIRVLVVSIILSMLIALSINRNPFGFRLMRTILLVPWAVPNVVDAIMWKWVFNYQYGIVNHLLMLTGVIHDKIQWLNQGNLSLWLIVLAFVWKTTPFLALLLLASLQSIPNSLYEAATMDGASSFQQFRFITFPVIRNKIAIVLTLETMWAFKSFDLTKVLTNGGPGDDTRTLIFYSFDQTFRFQNIGYGAALSYFVAVIILLISIIYSYALKKEY